MAAKRAATAKGGKKPAAKRRPAAKRTKKPAKKPAEPRIRLGNQESNGIGGSLYGLVERGIGRQPRLAKSTRGIVLLRFKEDFAPVRISFEDEGITIDDVESANARKPRPDLTVSGSLPDIVHLATAPLIGGIPRPTAARGRAALARFAGGRVKIEGSPLLARRLLKLLEI